MPDVIQKYFAAEGKLSFRFGDRPIDHRLFSLENVFRIFG
jgi:hypothetical protein